MFDDQLIRLLREKWPNATLLAEELFAILSANRPTLTNNPLVIDNPEPNQPAIIIRQSGDSPFAFQIQSPDPTQPTGVATQNINNQGQPVDEDGNPESSGGGTFPGQVVSGSGTTYLVKIYENGTGVSASQTVSARIGNLPDPNVVLAADTWVIVMQLSNGRYEAMFFAGRTPGKVLSQVSGRVYNVALYENGQDNPTTRTVQATCMQLATGEVVPTNTWVDIFQGGASYYFQVPIWLE